MDKFNIKISRSQLMELCSNLGLSEEVLEDIYHLWNQKQEKITNDIEDLLKSESAPRKRLIMDHSFDGNKGEEKFLAGYDPLQELVFVTDSPYGYSLNVVPLSVFVTDEYEIPVAAEQEEILKDDLPF